MTTRRSALKLGGAAVAAAVAVPALGSPASARSHGFDPKPGSNGVGDPLFPTLGNGGYQVVHYDLTFDFTPVTYDFTAAVRINARATQDLSAFNLDTDGHTIDSVTVDGRPTTWELTPGQSGQEFTVTPARPLHHGRAFTAEVRYRGNGKAPRLGLSGWKFG
ncbi:M1 family peptidase, partial [Streptomyces sp. NPDC007076]